MNAFLKKMIESASSSRALQFLNVDNIQPPEGLPTGFQPLDEFLLWRGLPKGALTYISGHKGLGLTSLWIQTALQITQKGKQVAWVEDTATRLNPWSLRLQGLCLNRLFWVSEPKDLKQKLWVMQELCSLDFFEMITCSLGTEFLKDHQLLKLKRLAQRHHTALVFLSPRAWSHPYLALSLSFQEENLVVLRALHRPTPYAIERRKLYAHTLPEFAPEGEAQPRRELFGFQSKGSLP